MTNNSTAITRLTNDYRQILSDPIPNVLARPTESNIFEWHFIVFGTAGTPYEDGYYHGKLIFPSDFPFKPPRILMLTPSGRFATNTALCFSISDHHPESWNPTWTVSTIIMGIVSFMNDEREQTYGSMNTPTENRRKYAKNSKKFNLKSSEFCQIFPDLVPVLRKKVKEEKTEETNSIDKEACSSESELEEAEYENQ